MCAAASPVSGSRGSAPAIAPSTTAASVTERVIGPGTSKSGASGRIPNRLTRPSVVFTPTMPFAFEGLRIEPEVSGPIAAPGNAIEDATPEPALEPDDENAKSLAFTTWPPSDE